MEPSNNHQPFRNSYLHHSNEVIEIDISHTDSDEEKIKSRIEEEKVSKVASKKIPKTINTTHLESTLSDKFTTLKTEKRVPKKVSSKTIEFAKKTPKSIDNRKLFLEQIDRWEDTNDPLRKLRRIERTCSTLDKYISGKANLKNKKKLYEIFTGKIYAFAMDNIHENLSSSFFYLKLLLEMDIKHIHLLAQSVSSVKNLFDEILYNMTVCISNMAKVDINTAAEFAKEMIDYMEEKSLTPLIGQIRYDQFIHWLEKKWDDEGADISQVFECSYSSSEEEEEEVEKDLFFDLIENHFFDYDPNLQEDLVYDSELDDESLANNDSPAAIKWPDHYFVRNIFANNISSSKRTMEFYYGIKSDEMEIQNKRRKF